MAFWWFMVILGQHEVSADLVARDSQLIGARLRQVQQGTHIKLIDFTQKRPPVEPLALLTLNLLCALAAGHANVIRLLVKPFSALERLRHATRPQPEFRPQCFSDECCPKEAHKHKHIRECPNWAVRSLLWGSHVSLLVGIAYAQAVFVLY